MEGPTHKSQREASKILNVPRTTIQHWTAEPVLEEVRDQFFDSITGCAVLQRILMAAVMVLIHGPSGIRGIQQFLRLSGLSDYVGSSIGALQQLVHKFEKEIGAFGDATEAELSKGMPSRELFLGADETFHHGKPCLVAIELLSNFIVLETYALDRTAQTWTKAMNERLASWPVKVRQVTSDDGSALLSLVRKELRAAHSPDLFHVQQELSKVTAAPLRAQAEAYEEKHAKAEKEAARAVLQHGAGSLQAVEAAKIEQLRRCGARTTAKRREDVKEAIRSFGTTYHPVDLTTGALNSPAEVEKKLTGAVQEVVRGCKGAGLKGQWSKAADRVGGLIKRMTSYMTLFFEAAQTAAAGMLPEQEEVFRKFMLPIAYLELVIRKVATEQRKAIQEVLQQLRAGLAALDLSEGLIAQLNLKAQEVAGFFQRSSSCVEGHNGYIRSQHHRLHGLSKSRLKAITVVHNYHRTRPDGSTAAQRFFGKGHADLFDYLVDRIPIPRPRAPRARQAPGEKSA